MSNTITATAQDVESPYSTCGATITASVSAAPVAATIITGVVQQPSTGVSAIADASDVSIASVQPGDVLRYDSGRWRNYADMGLTDGGNF